MARVRSARAAVRGTKRLRNRLSSRVPQPNVRVFLRSKDAKPEWLVRSTVHRMGFRYRLHSRALPGCPDLVFAGRRKVIFVHGCVWHGLDCRAGDNRPASRRSYRDAKLDGNKKRGHRSTRLLRRDGCRVLTVPECQIPKMECLACRLRSFLETT